jgi:hypothetical protein
LCREEPREETSHCSRRAWWERVNGETLSLICLAESAEAFHLLFCFGCCLATSAITRKHRYRLSSIVCVAGSRASGEAG